MALKPGRCAGNSGAEWHRRRASRHLFPRIRSHGDMVFVPGTLNSAPNAWGLWSEHWAGRSGRELRLPDPWPVSAAPSQHLPTVCFR